MSKAKSYLSKYYGQAGGYLKDHASFLNSASVENDLSFLVKALSLKKTDTILDIACGQGRHTNALSDKGYQVDGIDFSRYLLNRAKMDAKKIAGNDSNFYQVNVENFKLKKKYDKAYWFFSDLANINIAKAILAISDNLMVGGRVLFDTDNIFRILSYLQKNRQFKYTFDAQKLELIEKKTSLRVPYPVLSVWKEWFSAVGFSVERVIGNYDFSQYSISSPRLIMIVKKTA